MKEQTITIRVSAMDKAYIKAYAEYYDMSVTDVIRMSVRDSVYMHNEETRNEILIRSRVIAKEMEEGQ